MRPDTSADVHQSIFLYYRQFPKGITVKRGDYIDSLWLKAEELELQEGIAL